MIDNVLKNKFNNQYVDLLQLLAFEGNVIQGYKIFEVMISNPALRKNAVFPSDTDDILHWLLQNKYLKPIAFRPTFSRAAFIGLQGYNKNYINNKLKLTPIYGHYVDWDYEVIFNVDKLRKNND